MKTLRVAIRALLFLVAMFLFFIGLSSIELGSSYTSSAILSFVFSLVFFVPVWFMAREAPFSELLPNSVCVPVRSESSLVFVASALTAFCIYRFGPSWETYQRAYGSPSSSSSTAFLSLLAAGFTWLGLLISNTLVAKRSIRPSSYAWLAIGAVISASGIAFGSDGTGTNGLIAFLLLLFLFPTAVFLLISSLVGRMANNNSAGT